MLDSYLSREDVSTFIKNIKTNERYFNKANSVIMPNLYSSKEEALYIFYDALLKYKIIINDIYLFDEYLEQIEKLYRKLDNFSDIRFGINKLICKILVIKFDIKDIEDTESKDLVILHIYNRYIRNGYYVHGFSSTYIKEIEREGFTPEVYENYYGRFININKVFAKNNAINIISKNFNKKEVFFTDDFVLGCYYSMYSPLYFSKFLINEEFFGKIKRKDSYLIDNYSLLISPLKRFMNNNLFNESDKRVVLDLVNDEWQLLHREDKRISLLLVKRKIINSKEVELDKFLNDENDLYEIVDRLLNSKYNNVSYSNSISKEDMEIIVLDPFYDKVEDEEVIEEDLDKEKEEAMNKEFLNKYGSVSYLLLFGSLFITLGVIFTIFKAIGG